MNARIQELVAQAGMTLKARRPYYDDEPDGYLESDDDFFQNNLEATRAFFDGGLEKFAELMIVEFSDIVKETAIVVAQTAYSDGEDAVAVQKRVAGALRVLDVMRERFGVE